MGRLDAGQNKAYVPPAKPRKVVVRKQAPTRPPVTDVQSSGAGYGLKKANTFKKTRVYKVSEGAAKPVRQTDATSSSKSPGQGYGIHYAHAYVQYARDQVSRALGGKPFDPAGVAAARDLHIANELRVKPDGTVIHIHHRDILPDIHTVLDPKKGGEADVQAQMKEIGQQKAGSPVMSILNETARPLHAIAGLANAGTHGFTEGLLHNKQYTFGQALKGAGVPSGAAGVAGFALDVGLDPTTYVSGGSASLERKAALSAAEKATVRAVRGGMSEAGAANVARAAAKKAAAAARTGKGVTVKFAGHDLPGVTTATAAAARVAKRVAVKAPRPVKGAATATKDVVRDVRPQLRPAGTPETQFVAVRQAGRKARASARAGIDQATQRARGVADRLSKDEHGQVINAIETGKIKSLPPHLHPTAVFLRDEFRHAQRLRRNAGIPEGSIRNYFPHARKDVLEGEGVVKTEPVPPKGPRTVAGPARKIKDTIANVNAAHQAKHGEDLFSTNVPLVYQNYGRQTAVKTARAQLYRDLAAAGEKATSPVRALHPNEALYHVGTKDGRYGIREVPGDQVGKQSGQYVILNKRLVDQQLQGITQAERSATGKVLDRSTSAFKRIATFTPGFHARNLVGDTQMAYLAQPGYKLPLSAAQSGRALRRLSETERAQRTTLGKLAPTAKTIKVAGQPVGLDQFLAGAKTHGVIRSGYIGRELEELKGVGKGAKRVTKGGTEKVKRWMQNREDLMRLATYKHGLDKGLSPAQAADLSLGIHIDYGDLTGFERRVARRAVPFYTFSARGLPIHAKALVQRPGKYANIEKFREEAATASGLNLSDEQKKLKTFQARQAPLILTIGGKKMVLSDSLPLVLLNEVPTSTDPAKYISEISQWLGQLASPIIKDPVEFYSNRSFFFRSDIQNQSRPLVAAPDWVSVIYHHDRALAQKLGIVPDYLDKQTGRKVWGWNGKADYVAKAIPGLPSLLQQLTTSGTSRRGQNSTEKLIGGVLGVKAEPLDPVGALMEALYPKLNTVTQQIGALNQRGIKAGNATPEYLKLQDQQRQLQSALHQLSAQRGDTVPMFATSKTTKYDAKIRVLEAKRKAMVKKKPGSPGAADDGTGTESPGYAQVLSELSGLRKARAKVLKTPTRRQLRRIPLTPEEKAQKRMDDAAKAMGGSSDAEQRALDRAERAMSGG